MSVLSRARELGMNDLERRPFTPEDVETLQRLASESRPLSEIAAALDRSADVVRGAAKRRGIKINLKTRPHRRQHARVWTREEYDTLMDLLAVGYPRLAVAQRLGRSVHAVSAAARKWGVRILRGKTVGVQIQMDFVAHDRLVTVASHRGMSPPTMARVIVELCIHNPVFLNKLLDDGTP